MQRLKFKLCILDLGLVFEVCGLGVGSLSKPGKEAQCSLAVGASSLVWGSRDRTSQRSGEAETLGCEVSRFRGSSFSELGFFEGRSRSRADSSILFDGFARCYGLPS